MSAPAVKRTALTARTVKILLTRGGVAHTELTMVERHGEVIITGPKERRRDASHVLYDAGLACAPYPDRDWWRRTR